MPGLALPFALVATSVAFFSILAFGVAFDGIRCASPFLPSLVGIPVGATAGAILRRWRALHDPLCTRDSLLIAVGAIAVLAGGAVGATVGIATWDARAPFMLGGAIAGLAFLPACVKVVDASRRAARARLGSVVASVDRRTAHATLLVVVAIAATIQAPALVASRYTLELPVIVQALASTVITGAVTVAIARLYALDRAARSRLDTIVRDAPSLDRLEGSTRPHAARTESGVDLGLGSDRWTRETSVDTYRSSAQREVLLEGSIDEARTAIDEAIEQRRRSLAIGLGALVVSTWSAVAGAYLSTLGFR